MNPEALAKLFDVSYRVLLMHVDGLTQEDSLVQPQPAGNSLNWVLGHIVATRGVILVLLGEQPVWTDEQATTYNRGSKGIREDGAGVMSLDQLVASLKTSQDRLVVGLGGLTSADLAKPFRNDTTVGDRLGFLQFHESYHSGQVALLRRLAGKEGVIK